MPELLSPPECESDGSPDDRRREPRVGCPSRPALRYATRPGPAGAWGYAVNVSADGLCFLAGEPVQAGAALELQLQGGTARAARVSYCAPTGLGSWLVGCRVSPPFSLEEEADLL